MNKTKLDALVNRISAIGAVYLKKHEEYQGTHFAAGLVRSFNKVRHNNHPHATTLLNLKGEDLKNIKSLLETLKVDFFNKMKEFDKGTLFQNVITALTEESPSFEKAVEAYKTKYFALQPDAELSNSLIVRIIDSVLPKLSDKAAPEADAGTVRVRSTSSLAFAAAATDTGAGAGAGAGAGRAIEMTTM